MRSREPVSPAERAWIEKLDGEIWQEHMDLRGRSHVSEKRELTVGEVMQLWKIIRRHELPCMMCNTAFGFHVGMVVADHAIIPEVPPERLIVVSGTQLPDYENRPTGRKFKAEFEFFARFTHTEPNRQLLAYYKLPEPQSMGHYDY